jgi:hypothetical protein
VAVNLSFDIFSRHRGGGLEDVADDAERAKRQLDQLGRAHLGGLISSMGTAGTEGASSFGKAFSGGLSGVLSTPYLGPIILAALLGVVAAIAPVIATAAAAAILGGLGAGLVGIGALVLSRTAEVQAAVKQLGGEISRTFTSAAEPLKGPFLRALNQAGDLVLELGPSFRQMFEQLAPAITPLTHALFDMVRNIMPGLLAAMPAVVVVFTEFAAILPPIGSALAELMVAISGNEDALRILIQVLGVVAVVLIKGLGGAIRHGMTALVRLRDAINYLRAHAAAAFNGIVAAVANAVRGASTRLANLVTIVRSIPGRVLGALASLPGAMFAAGGRIVSMLAAGIRSRIGEAIASVSSLAAQLRSFLPFSPAKRGPLSGAGSPDRAGAQIALMLAGGMRGAAGLVDRAAADLAGRALLNPTRPGQLPAGEPAGGVRGSQAAGGGGGVLRIESGGGRLNDLVVELLREAVRAKGGLQVVFGT